MELAISRAAGVSRFEHRDWAANEMRPSVHRAAGILAIVEVPPSLAQSVLDVVASTNMERLATGRAPLAPVEMLSFITEIIKWIWN